MFFGGKHFPIPGTEILGKFRSEVDGGRCRISVEENVGTEAGTLGQCAPGTPSKSFVPGPPSARSSTVFAAVVDATSTDPEGMDNEGADDDVRSGTGEEQNRFVPVLDVIIGLLTACTPSRTITSR
ncbi:hypothetical protein AAG570_001918 [Ranatra chinensis]|uniref:Uncharacterized protein n=1 Tax=Ranatra chinensis TaxID=642074 RepID=A0ABD0YWF2_9HEMI